MNSVHVSTVSAQDHATPHVLLGAIQEQFGCEFTIDLAASEENKKCDRWIGVVHDALNTKWKESIEGEPEESAFWREHAYAGWLNPPFRGVDPWMEKCKIESTRGCRIVSLTLASLGTGWYRNHVEGNALSLILRKRIVFLGQKDPFPKELMITLWGFGMTGLGFWDLPAWAVKESAANPATKEIDSPQDEELWPLEQEA